MAMPLSTSAPTGVRSVLVHRRGGAEQDLVVVEEPLEIRVDGRPLVVTMRTPGHDEELAAGFLYAERLIAGGADITSVRAIAGEHGGAAGADGGERIRVTNFAGDHVEVTRVTGAGVSDAPPIGDTDREFRATAACGVCGKASTDDLIQDAPSVRPVVLSASDTALIDRLESLLKGRDNLLRGQFAIVDRTNQLDGRSETDFFHLHYPTAVGFQHQPDTNSWPTFVLTVRPTQELWPQRAGKVHLRATAP